MSSNGYIDLRSDTVTVPTDEMRRAMAAAEVGDDCYGEDPTVNQLQDLAAEVLGCEDALYVPTGTMANQVSLRVLASPGGEVICDENCHLIHYESGASALLAQVQLRGLPSTLGVLEADPVRGALRADDPFQPKTVLLSLENTHNGAGGTVWPLESFRSVASIAREAGIPVYCDGARLFNACVARDVRPSEYAASCDLVGISLYKGLAAPMGSLVCGRRELIEAAWLARRTYGGALRQAGIVAAAGIVGLRSMIERLADDHENARRLAEGLAEAAPPGSILLERVHTNMVVFDAEACGIDRRAMLEELRREGVLAGLNLPGPAIRFVTHKDIDRRDIDRAVGAFARSLKALP